MRDDLPQLLGRLGFSEYEAKAYLALLHKSPLSGYAIARVSGVPRSKIYEVLGSLVERGDVFLSCGEPVLYAPKPTEELLESRRKAMEKQLADAEAGLRDFTAQSTPTDLLWDIRGRTEIIFRINEVISRARHQLLLQFFDDDVEEIRENLEKAAARGVQISAIVYGDLSLPYASIYPHDPGKDEILADYGSRWMIVSMDGREIVTGIISMGKDSRAAWSAHLGIVMPITEQIKHDLYIAVMLKEHREVLEKSYGPSLLNLRQRFGPPTTVYRPDSVLE